jgi:glycerate kinase
VANAIKKGVKLALPDAQLIVVPVADGGEGTLSAYLNALGGQMRESQVNGPDSNFVTARWGIVNSGSTAVIETYEAIGITKVRQPTPVLCELSSEGVGQLILEALDLGIRDFIVTIGGTATNDAGYGLLNEIGFRFLGSDATPVAHGACSLEMIAKIDSSSIDGRLNDSVFSVVCDGDIPLTGPRGASLSRSRQKGAIGDDPEHLEKGFLNFARQAQIFSGIDLSTTPMAGCGGGISGAMMAFLDASLVLGIDQIAELSDLENQIAGADLTITGEGRVDDQTSESKAPIGVALISKKHNVPVLFVAAQTGPGYQHVLDNGVSHILQIGPSSDQKTNIMNPVTENTITQSVAKALKMWQINGNSFPESFSKAR